MLEKIVEELIRTLGIPQSVADYRNLRALVVRRLMEDGQNPSKVQDMTELDFRRIVLGVLRNANR